VETQRTDKAGLDTAASMAAVHWCLDAVEQVFRFVFPCLSSASNPLLGVVLLRTTAMES
jgi:hypothetical protein